MKESYIDDLARQLKDLAPAGCSTDHDAKDRASLLAPLCGYAAAKVYSGPDFTWFYLDNSLIGKLAAVNLYAEPFKSSSPELRDKDKYRILGLTAANVAHNEDLFREVLAFSVTKREQLQHRTKRFQ